MKNYIRVSFFCSAAQNFIYGEQAGFEALVMRM
jgi:hypothetical protein